MKHAIGIDIGGTNTKIGLVDENGKILDSTQFKTNDFNCFSDFSKYIKDSYKKLLNNNSLSSSNILGVGVGAPNANSSSGIVHSPPNIKYWGEEKLVSTFESLLKTKVLLENDANVAALGEGRWGQAKGAKDYIVVTLGTGLGTGIVSNGSLIKGHNAMASEGGHITIFPDGRMCNCGGRGHLEQYVSINGIELTTQEITQKKIDFYQIFELYKKNDVNMIKVFQKTAFYLGFGLASMGNILAPRLIILAGGIANAGVDFKDEVKKVYEQNIYPPFKNQTQFLISNISTSDGAIMGAASLIF